MNFNYFIISYSVIYAKYNYCYEVPRDKPTRYFDGKDWKIMKARQSIRTKAPRYSSISVDWAEIIKEIKENLFDETATPMPSCGMSITDTTEKATNKRSVATKRKATTKKATIIKRKATTKKATTTKRKATTKKATTTKRTTTIKRAATTKKAITKKITIKKLPAKKTTTKIAATPKNLIERLRRNSHSTTTSKALPQHCRPVCKLKLKNATTTTIDPRVFQMTTFGDWRDDWNYLRPTKKHSPVTPKKFTPKATTKVLIQTTKKVTITTTRKPVVTTEEPVLTTKEPLTKTQMPVKCSGKQETDGTSTGNWSNLLKEFLKFVESKKCKQPPCESLISKSTMPYIGYRVADNRNSLSDNDDLMNILMDGVQIDDRRNEEVDYTSQSKDMLEYNSQGLNYESIEGSVARNSIINNDYAEAFNLKSLKDSIKNRGMEQDAQSPKKMGHLKKAKAIKVNKDFVTSRFRGSETYSNELKEENAKKDEENLSDSFTISYSDELQDMRANKNYKFSEIGGSKAYFDELKDKTANKEDNVLKDNKIQYYSNELKDKHAQKEFTTSRIRGSEVNEISQNSIKKYFSVALMDNIFSGIGESNKILQDLTDASTQKENEIVEDSELKFYINILEDKHAKKDYVTPRTSESEIYSDELKDKDARIESKVLQDGELKSHINALKGNVTPRFRGSKSYSDALEANNEQQENEVLQNNELKLYIDAFKDKNAKKENKNSQITDKSSSYLDPENDENEFTETFNSKELNEIDDYVEPNRVSLVEHSRKTKNYDVLQDSDITFD